MFQNNRFDSLLDTMDNDDINVPIHDKKPKQLNPSLEYKDDKTKKAGTYNHCTVDYPALQNFKKKEEIKKQTTLENKKKQQKELQDLRHKRDMKELKEKQYNYKFEDGWAVMEIKDKKHPNRITSTGIKINRKDFNENSISPTEQFKLIVKALVNTFEDRRFKYITTYGIDEYNKMFLFPNYDYHYFNNKPEDNKKYFEHTEIFKRINKQHYIYSDAYPVENLPYKVINIYTYSDSNNSNDDKENKDKSKEFNKVKITKHITSTIDNYKYFRDFICYNSSYTVAPSLPIEESLTL